MPICGFNKKMLNGLEMFLEGLVEYGVKERAAKNNETIDQAIKREISDITRMLAEIQRLKDSGKRILTEGLVKFAMGFYLIIRKNKIEDYKIIIKKINNYFRFMDERYYSELEGKLDDMEVLLKLLNEREI